METLKTDFYLTDSDFTPGCYKRATYVTDTIYTFYDYKELHVLYTRGKCYVTDDRAERMEKEGLVSSDSLLKLRQALLSFFSPWDNIKELTVEEIYNHVCGLRLDCLGEAALEQDLAWRLRRATGNVPPLPPLGRCTT